MGLVRISESTVADPGFSPGGTIPKWGCEPIFFGRKLHENERILKGGAASLALSLDPPLKCSDVLKWVYSLKIIVNCVVSTNE